MYPTRTQRQVLGEWFDATRWTYNKATEWIEGRGEGAKVRIKDVRDYCVNTESLDKEHFVKGTPYDVRDEGARDAVKAFFSNMAKVKKNVLRGDNGCHFTLGFRSKKAPQEALVIHSKHWNHTRGVFADLFGKSWCKMKSAEPLPSTLLYDSRLIRTRLGEFYLCVPSPLEPRGENQAPDPSLPRMVALDPGVRTFQTTYSVDGQITEWGHGDSARIGRLEHAYDSLQKRMRCTSTVHRRRYRMKLASLRIKRKIRRIVDDLHCKLAKWLCSNFHVVLVPKFETSRMVQKDSQGRRRLARKTSRMMNTWAHYRFRARLLDKAREFPWCKVIVTSEEYTSKTCGVCGHVKTDLGGNKDFVCAKCGFHSDRDHNGARNVMLRYLTLGK